MNVIKCEICNAVKIKEVNENTWIDNSLLLEIGHTLQAVEQPVENKNHYLLLSGSGNTGQINNFHDAEENINNCYLYFWFSNKFDILDLTRIRLLRMKCEKLS